MSAPPDELRSIPKVELHLHLEGAMPLSVIQELARKYGEDARAPEWRPMLGERPYRDFEEFDRIWRWKNALIRELDDFALIASGAASRLAGDGVVYAELSFCPSDFARTGHGTEQLLDAARRGLDHVPAIEAALLVDLGRELGPRHAERQMRIAADAIRSHRVAGIGMGGLGGPDAPEAFAAVYAEARRLGLRTTVHAGEIEGPDTMLRTLRALRPDRVGHGTRAAESASLVEWLARERIPLEVCPSSNVYTRVVRGFSDHPARLFYQRGIPISLNTDDPVMFGTSLSEEYGLAQTRLGFSRDELSVLLKSAIEMSWMSTEQKAQRSSQLEAAQSS